MEKKIQNRRSKVDAPCRDRAERVGPAFPPSSIPGLLIDGVKAAWPSGSTGGFFLVLRFLLTVIVTGGKICHMELRRLLVRALEEELSSLDLYAVTPNVVEMSRGSDAVPARIVVQVPDETVKNLRSDGDPGKRDLMLFVRVPRGVVEKLEQPPPLIVTGTSRVAKRVILGGVR